jgi:hypothetical protein
MRVINVIVVKCGNVDSITSFGVFEEQLSNDVVQEAEKKFKDEVLALSEEPNFYEFEDNYGDIDSFVEDGNFHTSNWSSVALVWSDI